MTIQQIENLYLFYFLYNGADRSCDLIKQSPDYILEKWNMLIKMDIPNTIYPEIQENELYQKYTKTWGKNLPDSLLMFLIETSPLRRSPNSKYSHYSKLTETFTKYIGKCDRISNSYYAHIHPNYRSTIRDIISSISIEDKREVLLNNMLS